MNQLCSVSRVQLFVTLWTVAHPSPLSMGFFRSGLPFPPPGDLPDRGIKPVSPVSSALQADSLPAEPCVDTCPSLEPPFHPPLWVITRLRAERPVLYGSFPLALYFAHGTVYMSVVLSQFVPPSPSHTVSASPCSMSAPLCLPCKLRTLFPYSHILRCSGLGLQHMNFGGNNSVHTLKVAKKVLKGSISL